MERKKEKGLLSAGLPPQIIATTRAGQGQSQQSRRFIWVSHMVAGTQPLGSSSAAFPGAWTMIQIGSGASGIPDGTHVGCWSLRYCAARWHQWPALTGRVCLHKMTVILWRVAPDLLPGRTAVHNYLVGLNASLGNRPGQLSEAVQETEGIWRGTVTESGPTLWTWSSKSILSGEKSDCYARAYWLLGGTLQKAERSAKGNEFG